MTLYKRMQLDLLRRIMDSIHALGNIYYDKGRLEAYKIVALTASELRMSDDQGEKCE